MSSKPNVTIYYGLTMIAYSVGYVAMSAFSSVYLLDAGLTSGSIGILLAVSSMVSVLLQPYVGMLIDRNSRVSSKTVLMVIGALIVGFGLMTITVPGLVSDRSRHGVVSALYGISIMLLMLAQPFLNSLGMEAVNGGYPMNFGVGKGMGSLGYAAGSFAVGRLSVMYGPKSMPVIFSITFFVLIILLVVYPVRKEAAAQDVRNAERMINPLRFLRTYKRFSVILIGLILVYYSHALLNTFSLQILIPKGGSSSDMGTASGIAAVCELVTIVMFGFYMKHIKISALLKISGVFFTLKILFSYIVTNVTAFYLVQGFQMFGWGIMAIGIVYYVNDLVGENDKAQGQAYAGMAYTIASVIATFLGGNIIDAWGVNALLVSGTVCAFIGTAVLFVMITDNKKKINA